MSPISPELLARARDWAASDPDPATAAELDALLEAAVLEDADADAAVIAQARQELADAFSGTLQFGTAGLRAALGPGPNRMNRVVVRRAAAGFAAFLLDTAAAASEPYRPRAVVGFDARHNSDVFARETAAILTAAGIETFLMPAALPTPLLAFAVRALGCEGGVMVTASHNPPQDNGFKITLNKCSLHGDEIQGLRQRILGGQLAGSGRTGSVSFAEIAGPYTDWIVNNIALGPRKLKVAIDCGNGPTGPVSPGLVQRLGCEVIGLFTEPDGNFPNHHPDPTVEANLADLRRAVADHGCDVGIAYDGDGDRIGVIDEKGGILWGDRLLILLARAILRVVPGAAIVGEVKCSQTLFDDIARHGGRPVLSRVGHSLIKDRMKTEGAQLAGEMSGHIFYKHRYFGFDDATYTTCRLLEILSNDPRPMSELLADVPHTFATPEIRLQCPDDAKFGVVAQVAAAYKQTHEVIDIDGVRVIFADGWGLVRASNTGPVLVMRCEAQSAAGRDRIQAELTHAVEAAMGAPVQLGAH